jgi:hypothetical protein
MKRTLFFILVFLVTTSSLSAQNFPVGAWTQAELQMTKYDKDPSAHAVVMDEYGHSRINVVSDETIRLVYYYHVKIKIFDKDGAKHGTVEIPLYNGERVGEEISDVTGTTVYTKEDGGIETLSLDPKSVFKVTEDKNHSTVKFAMPGIRNNCIIEYQYRITTPYFQDLHDWQFQNSIPKIKSQYEGNIPGHWTFTAVIRGPLKLTRNISDVENDCFSYASFKANCWHFIYEMTDIPAFITEDYMTAPKNFLSSLHFELAEYTDFYNGTTKKLAQTWANVDRDFIKEPAFGGQIKRKDIFKESLAPIIADKASNLDKAHAVYTYLQQNIKWNKRGGIYSIDGIKKALTTHTGNSADINLALVAALNYAGIHTEAVLISTRDNGVVNKLNPVITEFNYVIAQANIDGKNYLLDATEPLLAFGGLPMRCLNDQGRVMPLDKPSYWTDIVSAQKQNNTYTFNLTLNENEKLKGTIINYASGYAGYLKRLAIKKFNTVDEYVENIDQKLPKVKILKFNIINLDSLDKSLCETYEVEIEAYDKANTSLSFNPFIFSQITTNPFKLADRTYPVDWGMPSETRYTLNMTLPDGYIIESPPQNINLAMPNNGGKFMTDYQGGKNSFLLSNIISFNKSIYSSEEYPDLKELYNKIIVSEKAEILFKKKK